MDAWVDIRREARGCHQRALARAKGDRRAANLVRAALEDEDLELRRMDFGPGLLGSLDRPSRLVNVAKGLDSANEAVVIAHEVGHFHLHRDPHNEVTVRPHGLGGDPVDSGAGRVEGYSPRERKEVQADIFAGEFLCPSDWLRDEFVVHGRRPQAIASELGLPPNLVLHQMIRALLLPPLRPAPPASSTPTYDLDESQKAAVVWDKGPLLVDAGPGTGKTRTLVTRIEHLLSKGSRPSSFLALTFSRKAAEEMRERLSAMDSAAAIEMWVGTFHAFGLELVTKWAASVGRTPKVKVLDQTGSLALLEANLETLPLHHYQNLYEPAYELVPVLRMISRCKDELVTPDVYKQAADAWLAAAHDEEEREDADKARELAEIYRIYEEALAGADAVDFGDLIRLAINLVKTNAEVQNYLSGFTHVLVDEFQDVNFASSEFLRLLSALCPDVWVVADQRQSIYRFRGAEPSNVGLFPKNFTGARQALENNYRSCAPIVQTFERFSRTMGSGAMAGGWKAQRACKGGVSLTVTPSLAAESESIKANIEEFRGKGVAYGEQVILARSHLTLARVTGPLEQMGLPLLYLGDLFERGEIRDLLSLVGLDAEFGGIGLIRVGALPEYSVPRTDTLEVIHWSVEKKVSIIDSLDRLAEIGTLSAQGRSGLEKLGVQLRGLSKVSPWTMLTAWLFERSSYLLPLLSHDDAASLQKRVAIYQLLKVCGEYLSLGDSSRRRFLDRIRRIEALNEDTAYRAISSEATDMDAVRVMTIHGSKGLEFSAVHLPAVATSYMPTTWRGVRIEPPPSLSRLAMHRAGHDAEEECLFFVALSRARDYLSITRAEQYTAVRGATESKFLTSLAGIIRPRPFQGSGKSFAVPLPRFPVAVRGHYQERDLDLYMQCPARYRYEVEEALRGGSGRSGYVRFHRCVYKTIAWIEAERQRGHVATAIEAQQQFNTIWTADGPVGNPFEGYYKRAAEGMIDGMVVTIASETGHYEQQEWIVPVGGHKVAVTPDRVILDADGVIRVQRVRTGRKTKTELEKPVYALLRLGARLRYPRKFVRVETLYLGTRERVEPPVKDDDKLLSKYTKAIAGIESGDFHPVPETRRCANCSCYFMCGGG